MISDLACVKCVMKIKMMKEDVIIQCPVVVFATTVTHFVMDKQNKLQNFFSLRG